MNDNIRQLRLLSEVDNDGYKLGDDIFRLLELHQGAMAYDIARLNHIKIEGLYLYYMQEAKPRINQQLTDWAQVSHYWKTVKVEFNKYAPREKGLLAKLFG